MLEPVTEEIEKLIASADDGRVMTEGVRTVILGNLTQEIFLMNVL